MLNAPLIIQVALFDSPLQQASITLRSQVLRAPLGLAFSQEELAAEFEQIHVVATIEGLVVGVLLLVNLGDNSWKMRQVATAAEFQGKGIGKQMVRFAENWLIKQQAKCVVLHARISASNFYRQMNYSTDEQIFQEVGIPHLKMWKELLDTASN